MNHKRGRPKSSRAGCLMCKPHKHQALKDTGSAQTAAERRADQTVSEEILRAEGEAPPRVRRMGWKDRRRWCKGRVGVPHVATWKNDQAWEGRFPKSARIPQILSCDACGKHLAYRYLCRSCGAELKWPESHDHEKTGCPDVQKGI